MPAEGANVSADGSNGNHRKLSVVKTEDTPPTSTLPPLDDDLPASRKVYLEDGEIRVPVREITVSGGEPPVRVYDTTGPQGHDVTLGLPKLRQAWVDRRIARGDRNF